VGSGEGRLPRDLKARGYDVIGVEVSPTLIEAARAADPDGDYRLSDAASLPLDGESVALVTAFMSLHDMDDFDAAVAEAARVLARGGRLCAAVVHPINSAGKFTSREPDAPFVISESYFDLRRITDAVESDGLRMTFSGNHRPLHAYVSAFASAGLVIERIVEVGEDTAEPESRWRRVPLFLHLRGLKP
jgi:SAM-dependent methyltransferase